MSENTSYTTEELARLLKISKLKVYDLIKKVSCLPTASASRCGWTTRIWRPISRIRAAAVHLQLRKALPLSLYRQARRLFCRRPPFPRRFTSPVCIRDGEDCCN